MRKQRLEEASVVEGALSSVAEASGAIEEVREDNEVDIREQASNHKDEVATNTMTIEAVEEGGEVEDSAGEIMTSHNETETRQSTSDQTGR
jgi:hypothetical protein